MPMPERRTREAASMPTLEDTIDFPVTTLNDLLEADAKGGVAVGADEDKYRRWAFLSSGAAGILAVILLVVLVTGTGGSGGGGSGGGKEVKQPPNTARVAKTVNKNELASDVIPGAVVYVTSGGAVIATDVTVLKMEDVAGFSKAVKRVKLELAVKQGAEQQAVQTADESDVQFQTGPPPAATPPATEPAPAAPAPAEPAPAPAPVEPAPAPAPSG